MEQLTQQIQNLPLGYRLILGFTMVKSQAEYVVTKVNDWMVHVVKKPSIEYINNIAPGSKGITINLASAIGKIVEGSVTYEHEEQEKKRTHTRLQKYVEDVFSGQWSDIFPSEYFYIGQEFDLFIINSNDEVLAEVAKGCDSEIKVSEAIADYITKRAIRINDFAIKIKATNFER